MTKIDAPYLQSFVNGDGTQRHYFAPRQIHRAHGWATVRLHDKYERPIRDPLEAATACKAVAEIYRAWCDGKDGFGPWRIDKLGRVVDMPARAPRTGKRYAPGTIGAMVADFRAHKIFGELGKRTQGEYTNYLRLFVEKFGDRQWRRLSAGEAREWLMARAAASGPAGAHSLYRTVRSFFSQIRLCYTDVDHPGIVLEHENPFLSLKLSLPKSLILMWPRAAIEAFIQLADEEGEHSIGDAILMMSWLGVRRQDWLDWPADFFDQPLIAFEQEKTGVSNVLPWSIIPELAARMAAAKERRAASAVRSTKFFHDRHGRPWGKAARFREAFNDLRQKLEAKHPTFPTRYFVGLVEGRPLALPTGALTMRTMRHTCVTLLFDAGVPPELIGGITGHSQQEIDDILAHYRARTADQAEAALRIRLEHEAKKVKA